MTSKVASDDGSTHSPPMKKRSAWRTGVVVALAVLISCPASFLIGDDGPTVEGAELVAQHGSRWLIPAPPLGAAPRSALRARSRAPLSVRCLTATSTGRRGVRRRTRVARHDGLRDRADSS